ncbi:MAG: T9SS type B sorting domain-containing protein [Lutibacter sp.]
MFKNAAILLLVLSFPNINAQIKLTHNIGETPIVTNITSCEEDESWSRVFNLSDFGVTKNEQFIIESGQVAISKSFGGAYIGFFFSSIDDNFPNSNPVHLGSGGYQLLPIIDNGPRIIDVNFNEPIVIPSYVKRILVTVYKSVDFYNPNSAKVLIAGTATDNDVSWFNGCRKYYTHTATSDLDVPVPDANFYINVTGKLFTNTNFGSSATLTHNICDNVIKTPIYACSWGGINWARTFVLNDFGISTNEEFIINSGQFALSDMGSWDVKVQFNIYEIDANFPTSFSESNLIGSSQVYKPPYFTSGVKIFDVHFETPIVIPAGVKMILVEVFQLHSSASSAVAFMGGTELDDNDFSWFKSSNGGCPPSTYTKTIDLGARSKFYINVTGNVNHVSNNFAMNISNICAEFLTEFSVDNKSEIAAIVWDFGDLASGTENTSTDVSPFHDFSADGTYTITATVTATNGNTEVLSETIDVKEPPKAYGINNLEACEDAFGTGISSSFDTANILSQVLGNQTNKVVTFIDGSGNTYDIFPNPFTNTIKDRETITVKVTRDDELCCSSEITFDVIVNPLPNVSTINNLFECETNNDGFANFNLEQLRIDYFGTYTNYTVSFYQANGTLIPTAELPAYKNATINEETITLKVENIDTNCTNETTFKLIVSEQPIANTFNDIIGCDDNNDGISEYFDTSTIETDVLNGQTGMEVSYYNEFGNQLASPLPNPYTNTKATQETITVRVTNPQTGCYAETFLKLTTSSKPLINQPLSLYSCYEENGIAFFNTSTIEQQLIGNQTGLRIFYSDENGMALPSPLPTNYQNTKAWSQKINVRVENQLNPLCYSETSFNLTVNELPQINLENDYFLCDLEPYLYIATDSNFDSWKWTFEDGSVISNSFEANLTDAGTYTLQITKINNGISCENSFSFNLVRSILPIIDEVKIQDISANNSIEIITSGDGDFEYSIDGFNYQDDNIFQNLSGGVYHVQVRDKKGCGLDNEEVVLVDYPKFFTPNNDGFNDYWQIQGIEKFPNTVIYIFDRFGKLLKQLTFKDLGWNGTYNGQALFASDYWFTADLGDGRTFKGHFSLKR